jgi:hypothetical protein
MGRSQSTGTRIGNRVFLTECCATVTASAMSPVGPIAIRSGERQVWPCPLCLESGRVFQSLANRDRSLRTCRTEREVVAAACRKVARCRSANLARTLSHRCAGRTCCPGGLPRCNRHEPGTSHGLPSQEKPSSIVRKFPKPSRSRPWFSPRARAGGLVCPIWCWPGLRSP